MPKQEGRLTNQAYLNSLRLDVNILMRWQMPMTLVQVGLFLRMPLQARIIALRHRIYIVAYK